MTTLIKSRSKSDFDIGILLHNIKKNGWYEGYGTFAEFVSGLEMKARTAAYLRRIAEVMEALSIPREKYEPVGKAKLRHIASLGGEVFDINAVWTNPENKEVVPIKDFILSFIDKHETMTTQEIARNVRTLKGFVGEDDVTWLRFCVTRAVEVQVVEPAKELVRRNIGSAGRDDEGMAKDVSDGACLEAWAANYLNDPNNQVEDEHGT